MTQWGIDTLFNPGKRHMDEEKRRLQSTREEVGDSSGGRRIDLEGGKVTLAGRPGKNEATDDEPDAATTADAGTAPDAATTADAGTAPDAATAADENTEQNTAAEEPDSEDTPAARARRRRRQAG